MLRVGKDEADGGWTPLEANTYCNCVVHKLSVWDRSKELSGYDSYKGRGMRSLAVLADV